MKKPTKPVENINDMRRRLAELEVAAADGDRKDLPRVVCGVNAMGKITATIAIELKAAEINKTKVDCPWLTYDKTAAPEPEQAQPPVKKGRSVKVTING